MPASYRIDVKNGIVYSRGWGILTDDELIAHQKANAEDPRFRRDMHQLLDGRAVADVRATPEGVRKLAAGNPFGKGAKRALVAGTDIAFGMARMYELGRSTAEDEFRVFRCLEDALAWLGLPEGEPAATPVDWSSENH